MKTTEEYYTLAGTLIRDVAYMGLIGETLWFREVKLDEEGFDLEVLKGIIQDVINHIP